MRRIHKFFGARANNGPARWQMTVATVALLVPAVAAVRAQTVVDLRAQSRNVDFSAAVATKPFNF